MAEDADDFDRLLGEAGGAGTSENEPEQGVAAHLPNFVTSAAGAPTVFSDGCVFATQTGGVVRLTFVETILEPLDSPSPGSKVRHVGTLVLPAEGFVGTLRYLNDRAREFGLEIDGGE